MTSIARRLAKRSLQTAAAVLAVLPLPASAETAADQVETITVTVQKRAENLQDVPLSIVAFSGEQLQNAGVNSVMDLQKLVPDLQVTPAAQSAGIGFRIRGFGRAANSAIDSDVATYVDTAYVPRPGAIVANFLDVKSIEVLRGPQGTLFGRNAAMGGIAITTNAPALDQRSLELAAGGGSYGQLSANAVANQPLSDHFALRLALAGNHSDGYYKNQFDGKTYGGLDTMVGRLSLRWDLTADLTWTARLEGAAMNGDGFRATVIDTSTASPTQIAHLKAFVSGFGGTPPVLQNPPSFTLNQRLDQPRLHDTQYGLTSDLSWTLGNGATLRLIESYRNWSNRQTDGDIIFTTLDMLNRHDAFDSKAQSHELQFVTPKNAWLGHRLGISASLYYSQESYAQNDIIDIGSQFCAAIYTARPTLIAPCQAAPQTGATAAPFHQNAESAAGYVQATYAVSPELELTAGLRQTWDWKSGSFVQTVYNPYVGAGVFRAPESDPALRFSDSRPSWLAELSWHPAETVMAFATYSTGYKSGGFNSGVGATVPPTRSFGSETVDDFELGVKSTWWNNRLLLNATAFNTTLHDFQDRSYNGQSFIIRNAGSVRSRGVEMEGQIRPDDHVNLSFGLDYLDSIYQKNTGAPGLDGCTGLPGCPLTQNLSGRPLPFAPKWQGNAGAEFSSDPFLGGYIAVVALTTTMSSSYLSSSNDSPQTRIDGYGLLDGRLRLNSPDRGWQLELAATNILDRHYYVLFAATPLGARLGVNDTATGASLYRGLLGDPRILTARLTATF
jgi:iron complex outermembrane receptor protein